MGADVAELVEQHDAFAEGGHHRLVALFGGPAPRLGLTGIGELGAHHHPARRLELVVDERVDGDQDVDLRAVLAAVGSLAALEHCGAVGAVGGDHRADGKADHLILCPPVNGLGRLVPALDGPVGLDTDDRIRDMGDQAGTVAVGRLGRSAFGHVTGDDLVGGLAGPAGPNAGDLHHLDVAGGQHEPDLAVLEELPRLGELGQALGDVGEVGGVGEIGDRGAVVVGECLGVLLVGLRTDHSAPWPGSRRRIARSGGRTPRRGRPR